MMKKNLLTKCNIQPAATGKYALLRKQFKKGKS